MRLGIFGGTFDPVHIGHLIVAEHCREAAGLDSVLFIPAARPPHKSTGEIIPFAQRVEMLSLAVAGHPAFVIDQLEKDRAGPSFTVDTLAQIRQRDASADPYLILGLDMLQDFPTWHRPERILELATLLVVNRPMNDASEGNRCEQPAFADTRYNLPPSSFIDAPLIGISSTDIRQRVNDGRSIRFMTPRAVEMYIIEKGLYRNPMQA